MSATVSAPARVRWLPRLLSGNPHQIIGDPDAPYLRRWYLLPPNRHLNIYLHHFRSSDDDRALHDHPWAFASILIAGAYLEITDSASTLRTPGSIARRRADHRHRIQLVTKPDGTERGCWTLLITGPHRRQWGFWCGRRFVPWQQFGPRGCDSPRRLTAMNTECASGNNRHTCIDDGFAADFDYLHSLAAAIFEHVPARLLGFGSPVTVYDRLATSLSPAAFAAGFEVWP